MKKNETLNKLNKLNTTTSPMTKRKTSILKKGMNDSRIETDSVNSSVINEIGSPKRKSVYFGETKYNFHYNKNESPSHSPRKGKYSIDCSTNNKLEINISTLEKQPETSHNLPILVSITHRTENNISINSHDNDPAILISSANKDDLYKKGFENRRKKSDIGSLIFNSVGNNPISEESSPIGYISKGGEVNSPINLPTRSPILKKNTVEYKGDNIIHIIDTPNYPISIHERVGCISGYSAISYKNKK